MATGIPKSKSEHLVSKASNRNLRLLYDGKTSRNEIWSGRRESCELVWESTKEEDTCRLYYGDNLPILRALADDHKVRKRVRLIYIDPPFASNSVFQSRSQADAYADTRDGAEYIDYLWQRFVVLKEILAEDGSIYVHLDGRMVFYIKVLMDDVFGVDNFKSLITRQKCNPKNYTKSTYGNVSDYILFYTNSNRYVWNRALVPWPEDRKRSEYPYVESATGRRYKKVPLHAPGIRNGDTGKPWKGIAPPPGKHWQYKRETLDRLDAEGQIYWSANGNPRRKVYADESEGIPVQDIWLDVKDQFNQNSMITGYPTEKNLNLLTRIIEASSNQGDLILDCFAGSGTTLEAANQLGRRWIGIDNSIESIDTIVRRLRFGPRRMGDYVKTNRPREDSADATATLPLFNIEPEQHIPGGLKYENRLETKPDFSLLVDKDYSSELEDRMGSWSTDLFNKSGR